jgi:hypothetical protein
VKYQQTVRNCSPAAILFFAPNAYVDVQATVNRKRDIVFFFRAMEVLDLLLTFQFNSRLESFIAKFKTADLSASGQQRGSRSLLVALLNDTFDPFDQSK